MQQTMLHIETHKKIRNMTAIYFKYNMFDKQDLKPSFWLLDPSTWCLGRTVRDGPAGRVLRVSRRLYSPSRLRLPATRWDGTFPHRPRDWRDTKCKLASHQQAKGSSICPSRWSTSDLPLFLHKPHSLFFAAILFHKVFTEAQTCQPGRT